MLDSRHDRRAKLIACSLVLSALLASRADAQGNGSPAQPTNLLVTSVTATSATLSWQSVPGATSYQIEVAIDSKFHSVATSGSTSSTSIEVSGLAGGMSYLWHVRSDNGKKVSDWKEGSSFITEQAQVVVQAPVAPSLVSPSNNARDVPADVTLSWGSVAGADSYRIQISTNNDFVATVVDNGGLQTTSFTVAGLAAGTRYYWRVSATNAAGTSPWSSTRTFTVVSIQSSNAGMSSALSIDPPSQLNVGSVTSTSAVLNWTGPSSAKFDIQVNPGNKIYSTGSSPLTVASLSPATTYDWQVRSRSSNDRDTSGWVAGPSFTTAPSAPTGLSANVTAASATLSWSGSAGATYNVQVSDKSDYSNLIVNASGLQEASTSVTNLTGETQYFWRVSATNARGTSGWSSSTFTTPSTRPSPPTNLSASNITTTFATLNWSVTSGASSYDLEYAIDGNFKKDLVQAYGLSRATTDLSGLQPSTLYYWHVRVTTAGGTSNWSSGATFTTTSGGLVAPTGLSSVPGAANVTLIWRSVPGASGYSAEVAADQNMRNTVGIASGADTSAVIGNLSAGKQYYWHVKATTSAGSSDWSSVAGFTTLAGSLAVPSLVSPDNGATGVPTIATLDWTAVSGATAYSLQYATDSRFTRNVGSVDGLTRASYSLGGLSPQTAYFWRVQARSATDSSGWTATWSFTTGSGALAVPSLIAPDNGSTGVSKNAMLSWTGVNGAATYSLQYSTDDKFKRGVVDVDGIVQASYSLSGLSPQTLYYWRVQAKGATDSSGWTATWSFTTGSGALAVPSLIAPDNGSTGVPTNATLSWIGVNGAATYSLQYSTDNKFKKDVARVEGIEQTSYPLSGLLPKTVYYWCVQAKGAADSSGWTVAWSFTTGSGGLAAPSLIAPDNGSTGVPTNATLSWTGVSGAGSYVLQYSTDDKFKREVVRVEGIEQTSYSLGGLLPQTVYYWRVQAVSATDSSGLTGSWSFATSSGTVAAPSLVAPDDGAVGVPTNVTLDWTLVSGAIAYSLEYTTDKNFKREVVSIDGLAQTSYSLSGLLPLTIYYWRVQAKNSTDSSGWASNWSFKTGSGALASPSLLSPDNGVVGTPTNPMFSWTIVSGATSYSLEYTTDNKFKKQVVRMDGLLEASYSLSGLQPRTTYYWHVQAKNDTDSSGWAAEWSFQTSSGTLAIPGIIFPANGAVGVSTSPMLSWTIVSGAASYSLEYSTDKNFKKEAIRVDGIARTSYSLSGALPHTTYYWHVQAKNQTDSSGWSADWSFGTGRGPLGSPVLLSPMDDAKAPPNAMLIWSSSGGATAYSVQVSTSQDFRSFVVNSFGLTSTSLTVAGLEDKKKYYWRVRATSASDSSDWTAVWRFTVSSTATWAEDEGQSIPSEYRLEQNYPNPFNPSTTIEFSLPKSGHVKINIYNSLGDLIHTLVDDNLTPGMHRRQWVASGLASGVYFYRIQTNDYVETKRLVLLK